MPLVRLMRGVAEQVGILAVTKEKCKLLFAEHAISASLLMPFSFQTL